MKNFMTKQVIEKHAMISDDPDMIKKLADKGRKQYNKKRNEANALKRMQNKPVDDSPIQPIASSKLPRFHVMFLYKFFD